MRSSTWMGLALAVWAALAGSPPLLGQDDASAKQKAVAQENAQKLGRSKPLALFEQDSLIVVGDLPESQLQRLAQALQKQYAVATKALGFTGTDRPWPGKLAVYVLSEKGSFASFVRATE